MIVYFNNFYVNNRAFQDYLEFGFNIFIRRLYVYDFRNSEQVENSPVVVSFATEDTPLYKIPFPAVTICPEAKYDTRVFNYSDIFYRVKDGKSVSKTK